MVQGIKTVDQARAEKKDHENKAPGEKNKDEPPAAAEGWGGAL